MTMNKLGFIGIMRESKFEGGDVVARKAASFVDVKSARNPPRPVSGGGDDKADCWWSAK